MKQVKNLILFIVAFFVFSQSFAQTRPQVHPSSQALNLQSSQFPTTNTADEQQDSIEFNQQFRRIIFDLRNSRGGNGDVAAGYLTAMDFIHHYGVDAEITFLVDSLAEKILDKISGKTLPANAQKKTLQALSQADVFDLYLSMASPSGTIYHYRDMKLNTDSTGTKAGAINLHSESVIMIQTVLGNTENPDSRNPNALIVYQGKAYEFAPAGIAASENGVYRDYIAHQLKDLSLEERLSFVDSHIDALQNLHEIQNLRGILQGSILSGSTWGLAYGITAGSVRKQVELYLANHILHMERTGPITILTPSRFKLENYSAELRPFLKVYKLGEALPARAERGYIYVVETPTLPHPVFVGLMSLSNFPVMLAGDGAMSAALTLGVPFQSTVVGWNVRNVMNLNKLLGKITSRIKPSFLLNAAKEFIATSLAQFPTFKSPFQDMNFLRRLFKVGTRRMKFLSRHIINGALALRMAREIRQISDPVLAKSIQNGGRDYVEHTIRRMDIFYSAGGSKANVLSYLQDLGGVGKEFINFDESGSISSKNTYSKNKPVTAIIDQIGNMEIISVFGSKSPLTEEYDFKKFKQESDASYLEEYEKKVGKQFNVEELIASFNKIKENKPTLADKIDETLLFLIKNTLNSNQKNSNIIISQHGDMNPQNNTIGKYNNSDSLKLNLPNANIILFTDDDVSDFPKFKPNCKQYFRVFK